MKIKLTPRKIFRYSYIMLFFANLVIVFFVYGFIKKYAYDTMFMERDELLKQSKTSVESINIKKFELVVEKIDAKKNKPPLKIIRNIFE